MSNFKIEFSCPWLLLLLIPALFLTLFPYFRTAKKFRRTRNRIISVVLHALSMTLCVALLAGMSFYYEVPNRQNELLLLVDLSDSNAEREEEKDEFVRSVIDACGDDYKIGIVTFGFDQVYAAPLSRDTAETYRQYLEAEKPDGSATDIASALNFAAGCFSNPKAAKILLISDGVETDGAAADVVSFIAAEGIRVDTANFSDPKHDEVQIVGVKMPEETIVVGQSVGISLTLQSNFEEEELVYVTLSDKGFDGDSYPFLLAKGTQTVEISHTFQAAGIHDLSFRIECASDTLTQNNKFCSYVNIAVFDNILILERNRDEAAPLADILSEDFNVTVLNILEDPEELPSTLKELCNYEQVILVNMSNGDLTGGNMPAGFDRLLYDYVYDLGGSLFTVGGENDVGADGNPVPHAYNRADMAGTLFQQMLPVQAIDYSPPLAVMLVIDCSGSMSSGRFDAALKGAEECLDSLTERDFCGVMGFSTSSSEAVNVLPVSQREKIRTAIRNLDDESGGSGSGGTVFSDAIDKAGRALAPIPVERKHIILVTDGNPSDHLDQSDEDDRNFYGKYIDYNYTQNGITMSVVTVGMTSGSREQMEKTAQRGHGGYYDVKLDDPDGTISVYMRQDLASVELAEIQDGTEFTPGIKDQTSVLLGIDSDTVIPPLKGYYGTKAKEGAKVPLTFEYVPIYASWKFGEGNVGSFMSDLNGNWSEKFIADSVGQLLIKNIAYSLAPAGELEADKLDYVLKLRTDNYTSQLDVYTECGEGERIEVFIKPVSQDAVNYYNDSVTVTSLGDNVSFVFQITCSGLYRVFIEKKDANGETVSDLSFYQTFSYSEEYNAFRGEEEGAALLSRIAADGRGAVLEDPVEVFETFGKTFPKTFDPRMVFLILAIVFVLLDIAVRKFKFKWPHEIVRDRRKMKELNGKKQ